MSEMGNGFESVDGTEHAFITAVFLSLMPRPPSPIE